jgi:hypothetical protein
MKRRWLGKKVGQNCFNLNADNVSKTKGSNCKISLIMWLFIITFSFMYYKKWLRALCDKQKKKKKIMKLSNVKSTSIIL